MIKAVLFDLDNTLIDFMSIKRASIDAAINAMLAAGLELEKQEASDMIYKVYREHGIEHQEIFQKFLKAALGSVDYKILAAGIVAYRKTQIGILEPYAQVIPTLIKLRERGLKLAIVSDAPKLKAWIRLVELRIHDFFDVVVTFDDTKKYKPNRAPFFAALNQLEIKPINCLMVGDRADRDIKGAKLLGIKTAYAVYGSSTPVKSRADYEINSIEEVLTILK